ncbi:CPBP family intramembrane metalloprotease [Fructobacillus sp. M2-14]|uniref:CPBP family intramembrane metalloprotease n=1 Tax=Fructobacillus broussonetiae TaxID=2713173 RepID=A0ABS5QZB4_9LACO|nr:CPBP family intramembrane glutamic endopeptidase [Fructobacillus broussonetiae]MBS9338545.1 CPBP family intramembrane metalloprotease [Fructobacillus broussonetiae]
MSLTQVSVLFKGCERYLWLVSGLILALVYSFFVIRYLFPKQYQFTQEKWQQLPSLRKIAWPTVNELGFIIAVYIIAFAALSVWSTIQMTVFSKWAQDTTENQAALDQLMNMGGRYSLIALSILIVLIGPIMEEFLFRGVFFKTFKKSKKGYLTVFFSGLLFGLYHLGSYSWVSLLDLPPYLILGLALAYVYQKTNKLSSSILLHMFHNGWVQATTLYLLLH